jgi:hypothetical protein
MRSTSDAPGLIGAITIYCQLDALGFRLAAVSNRIRIEPADRLTSDMTDRLREHKRTLLRFLSWPVLSPQQAALLRPEWFGGNEVNVSAMGDDAVAALARAGLPYEVQAAPIRPTRTADLPPSCIAALACSRLGRCGRPSCAIERTEAA